MDDRFLAYKILLKIERDKAYSNIAVDAVLKNNDVVSAPFVCQLVYGVIERKITLDYILSQFLTQPLKKLNPQVLTILRMGVYQIKFLDKVPDSAAVNESVKLVKKIKCAFASGLVNSVLRKISTNEIKYPETDNIIFDLSIKYSCPKELVKHYVDDYGIENTEEFLKDSIGNAPIVLRVNTLKTTADALIKLLSSENITATKCDDIENALVLTDGGAVFKTKAYRDGLFHVQDKASQICVFKLDPKPNEVVFDMCASPGGKSFTIAEKMKNIGELYSFDLYEHRVKLISDGAQRLGINIINANVGDASQFNDALPKADKILCDVPCSGLGVIRRKPEIRYKDLDFVDNLCELQYNILSCSAKYLKQNGVLVYSTCSLNKKENEDVCDKFLAENNDFQKVEDYITLWPHKNATDGFFIAKFKKVN
mgnify:FL=1